MSTLCPITHPPCFYLKATMSLPQGHHAMSMCPDIILFNLRHHVYTMRNHCPLTSFLTLTPSRLFPILLDHSSLCHVLSIHCRLIIILSIYVQLTLTLAKVCPHSCLITSFSTPYHVYGTLQLQCFMKTNHQLNQYLNCKFGGFRLVVIILLI